MTTSWSARVLVDPTQVDVFEPAFSGLAAVVSSYEQAEGEAVLWAVEGLFAAAPPRAQLAARIALAAEAAGVPEPALEIAAIPARDWLSDSIASFPPLRAGRFYIHGDHVAGPYPSGMVRLCVNAATAFGTGEHESTRGCLLALDRLMRRRLPSGPALDLGCGTGILAMAMTKTAPKGRAVVAVDIDPEAVRVTRRNAALNGVGNHLRMVLADGPTRRAVRGSYGLITANILARPLMQLARDLSRSLRPGGTLILSGFLRKQEQMVLGAYRSQGLHLAQRLRLRPWTTLVLRRETGVSRA